MFDDRVDKKCDHLETEDGMYCRRCGAVMGDTVESLRSALYKEKRKTEKLNNEVRRLLNLLGGSA